MSNPKNNTTIEILQLLEDYLLMNPKIRFCQALYNLNIVDKEDRFYEDSSKTLTRLRRLIEKNEY
jgi:hypothetical protein